MPPSIGDRVAPARAVQGCVFAVLWRTKQGCTAILDRAPPTF
jgi:hypothetical protein